MDPDELNLTDDEQFIAGSLIGTFVGDALGMPVEGWSHDRIKEKYGRVIRMFRARKGAGTYTDDTQMMVATARSLLETGGVDREHLAESFLEHYDASRGYGRGTTMVFNKWRNGVDVDEASRQIFEGGSFGNGGSMRIAPVGLVYGGDHDKLVDAIEDACGLTHAHPLGLGSSFLQAFAIEEAFVHDPEKPFEHERFFERGRENLPECWDKNGILTEKLALVSSFLDREDSPVDPVEVSRELGCSSRAYESVPTAIYAALENHNSFRDALIYAVGLGGDTDTIGAMTGAIAGALHGVSALPQDWWDDLENGEDGRDEILKLARQLVDLRGKWTRE